MAISTNLPSDTANKRGQGRTSAGDLAGDRATFLPHPSTKHVTGPEALYITKGVRPYPFVNHQSLMEPYVEPSPVITSGNSASSQASSSRPSQQQLYSPRSIPRTDYSGSTWGEPVVYEMRRGSKDREDVSSRSVRLPSIDSNTGVRSSKSHARGPSSGTHVSTASRNIPIAVQNPLPTPESLAHRTSHSSGRSLADSIQFLQILSQEGGAEVEAGFIAQEEHNRPQVLPSSTLPAQAPLSGTTRDPYSTLETRSHVPRDTSNIEAILNGQLRQAGVSRSGDDNSGAMEDDVLRTHQKIPSSGSASSKRLPNHAAPGSSDAQGVPILSHNETSGAQGSSFNSKQEEYKVIENSSTTIPHEIGGAIVDRLHDLEQRNRNLETALLALLNPSNSTAEKPSPTRLWQP